MIQNIFLKKSAGNDRWYVVFSALFLRAAICAITNENSVDLIYCRAISGAGVRLEKKPTSPVVLYNHRMFPWRGVFFSRVGRRRRC